MSISRKQFVAAAALSVPATLLADATATAQPHSPLHFHVLKPNEYDRNRMLATLQTTKRHKQVFQSVTPLLVAGVPSVYLHMQNSLNAYEFSYGLGRGSLATLGVLTGASIVYALKDAMWTRYGLGALLNMNATNTYYTASSLRDGASPDDENGVYQDWSAQAVLHRGGAFFVCHNAMTAIAGLAASKHGGEPGAILEQFAHNILPGFQIVPAGVAATQLALEHGWQNYPVM